MKKFFITRWIYFGSLLCILVDQIIKMEILVKLHNNSINVINGILKFTYCENKGVAFSLGSSNIWFFIVLNIIMILFLICCYEKNKNSIMNMEKIFYMLILSGGISNLLDRLIRGYVIDFIDINELFKFAIFNVADIMIVCGVIGYIIFIVLKEVFKNKYCKNN